MSEKRPTRRRHITGKLSNRPEEVMSALLESGNVPFCVVDTSGRFVVFNQACERISGYTLEELENETFFKVIDPGEHEKLRAMWARRGKGETVKEMDIWWRSKSGERRLIHWQFSRFEDTIGNLEFSAGIGDDITERRQVEEALRDSEARYRAMFEKNRAVKLVINPENAAIVDANAAAAEFYGYSLDELRRMRIPEINTLSEDQILAEMAKAKHEKRSYFQFKHRVKGGGVRDVEVWSGPIEISGRTLLYSIIHDVTDRKRAEQALRESEQRFSQLAESISQVHYMVACDFSKNYYVNPAYEKVWGRTCEELRAQPRSWLESVHPDDRKRTETAFSEFREGSTCQAEYRIVRPDGGIRWIFDRAFIVPFGGEKRIIGIAEDITSRKESELALTASEARYRLLIEEASEAICLADGRGGNIDANTRACELFGYTREEFRRLNIADTVPAEDRGLIGPRIGLMKQGIAQRWERDLLRKDGSRVPIEISARVLPDGRIMAIMRDVTERRRNEEALRESETRFRQLADAAPVFIWLADKSGRRTYFNRGWLEFTGRPLDDEFSDGWADGVHPEDSQRVLDSLTEALYGRQDFSIEYRLRASDGEYRWVLDHGLPRFAQNGEFAGYIGSCHDITERRFAEEERKRAAQALRESEQRYRAFIAQSTEGVWRFEFERPIDLSLDIEAQVDLALQGGILAECNDVMARMYGYQRAEEMVGVRIKDLLDMADPANREQFRFFARSKYRVTDMESHEIARDGTHHYFLNNVVGIIVDDKLIRIWGTQREVTDRRKAAQALRESEERYKRLSGATAEAIIIHEQGRVIDANQRAAEMLGYSMEELLKCDAFTLAAPESRELLYKNVAAGLETPYEAVALRKDGTRLPVELTARNLTAGGKPVRVVAIRDITERKRAEEALRHEAAVIRLLQRTASAANESKDVEGAIRECIEAVCAHTGWPVGNAFLLDEQTGELAPTGLWHIEGEQFAAFKRITDASRFAPGIGLPGRVLQSGKPLWISDVLADDNFPRAKAVSNVGVRAGFGIPVLVGRDVAAVLEFYTPQVVQRDERLLEIMGNIGTQLGRVLERKRINDMLENRVAERTSQLENANRELSRRAIELEAINKELESFSYSVSHDLRAPLRGIFGFSQALQEDFAEKIGPTGQAHLERIKAASQRMARLIDDLLGLSRVTRAEMKSEQVDLSALANEIVAELRKASPRRRVEANIEPGVMAFADARLMRVVLENLLDNAFKFTARKEGARVTFAREMRGGEWVYFVRDNGAGFEMQYAAKLFGPFQRLHSLREFEGTGIGLATVQRIVNRHGGRVWAEGKPEEGATVFFTLGSAEA